MTGINATGAVLLRKMFFKVLCFLAALGILGLSRGEVETHTLKSQENQPAAERMGANKDLHNDLDKDPAFMKLWNFWKFGRTMFKKVLNSSSEMTKTKSASAGTGRHRLHEDGRRKLKNKVKFLFKIHQYEI